MKLRAASRFLWVSCFGLAALFLATCAPAPADEPPTLVWTRLSSAQGDLEPPSTSPSQTASLVLDIDKDGINDFVIGCRRGAPALVWYKSSPDGWTRYIIDADRVVHRSGRCLLRH